MGGMGGGNDDDEEETENACTDIEDIPRDIVPITKAAVDVPPTVQGGKASGFQAPELAKKEGHI